VQAEISVAAEVHNVKVYLFGCVYKRVVDILSFVSKRELINTPDADEFGPSRKFNFFKFN